MIKRLSYSKQLITTLANVEKRCFGDGAWNENMLSSLFSVTNGYVSAYISNEQVVGYCAFYYALDEMQIANVAVLPEYRRRGAATELLKDAIFQARKLGCTKAELEVNTQNFNAVALYKKFGFAVAGVRKNYYGANEGYATRDAYTMTLNF